MPENDNQLWGRVDQYISESLVDEDSVLRETLRRSRANGLPEINVSPSQGKFLHLLARMASARTILEIGTLGGYSTIWLARALPSDGSLVTIEADSDHAALAERNITDAGLSGLVDIRVGDASEVLERMRAEHLGPFDFVFIDADKPPYPRYLELALELSRPGTVIVGDNVVRRGRLPDESTSDESVNGVRRFMEMLGSDERLDATAIQTVGAKGYDGFAVAIVR